MDHQTAIAAQAAERYLLDEMSEAERHEFEAHYFECAECAADVRSGAAMADAVRSGNGSGAAVLPFAPAGAATAKPARGLTPWLSMAAALLFAFVAGYQALVVIPGLREGAGAQALSPVVLRPVSRGDLPVVTRPEGRGPVTLSMDVNLDPLPAQIAYRLTGPEGAEVVSGRIASPAPGTPLLLLVPAANLSPGRHELQLRDASGGSDASVYRFDVR